MQTIDMPQSASMYRYLEKKAMQLEVARKAFIRIRDVRHVELVNRTEAARKAGVADGLLMAEIMAYQGRYQEAARLFINNGAVDKAMEMFSDLRQFDEAKKWAEEFSRTKGDTVQAEWSEEVKNYDAAAEMYIKAKKFDRAIAILAKHGWWEKLIEVVRVLDRGDAKNLNTCATHFRKAGQYQMAKETLLKLDDTRALISLYVDESKWDDAFLLLNAHPGQTSHHQPHSSDLTPQGSHRRPHSSDLTPQGSHRRPHTAGLTPQDLTPQASLLRVHTAAAPQAVGPGVMPLAWASADLSHTYP
ncbi:WD_REPEATS_REGION domain-containing protein, partial [Haematococcus lacustris]